MERIVNVHPMKDFQVSVRFADGYTALVDIKPFIRGGISDQLLDQNFFKEVLVDEFYGITWKNGFDFCPNFLRQYINERGLTK